MERGKKRGEIVHLSSVFAQARRPVYFVPWDKIDRTRHPFRI